MYFIMAYDILQIADTTYLIVILNKHLMSAIH